jgi:hypothetical protein
MIAASLAAGMVLALVASTTAAQTIYSVTCPSDPSCCSGAGCDRLSVEMPSYIAAAPDKLNKAWSEDLELAYSLCLGQYYAAPPPHFTLSACEAISEKYKERQRLFIESVAKELK